MEAELGKALLSMGTGGLISGIILFFYRGRTTELTQELIAARSKIDTLQAQIVTMLTSQLESEPTRRETLSKLTRLVEDQSALLKGKFQ